MLEVSVCTPRFTSSKGGGGRRLVLFHVLECISPNGFTSKTQTAKKPDGKNPSPDWDPLQEWEDLKYDR